MRSGGGARVNPAGFNNRYKHEELKKQAHGALGSVCFFCRTKCVRWESGIAGNHVLEEQLISGGRKDEHVRSELGLF